MTANNKVRYATHTNKGKTIMTEFDYITTTEMREDLGGVSRQYIHQIIKSQTMRTIKRGGIVMVKSTDFQLYKKRRLRRDLAQLAGRESLKFIKTADFDTKCPKCKRFAVNWKGTIACVNGHIIHPGGK